MQGGKHNTYKLPTNTSDASSNELAYLVVVPCDEPKTLKAHRMSH